MCVHLPCLLSPHSIRPFIISLASSSCPRVRLSPHSHVHLSPPPRPCVCLSHRLLLRLCPSVSTCVPLLPCPCGCHCSHVSFHSRVPVPNSLSLSPRVSVSVAVSVCHFILMSLSLILCSHVSMSPRVPPSHIFLGFSKCGRYVLSYTSSSGDDDFSFYLYHLYWWEFNVHSKLRLVGAPLGTPLGTAGRV